MAKIFGEENFIPDKMITLIKGEYNRKIDEIVLDKLEQTLHYQIPEIKVDRDKLEKWLRLCIRLENIDKSTLIDIATKKKFDEKEQENKVLKKALELACEKIQYYASWDPDIPNNQSKIQEYLIKQAKESMNEQV